ncbi:type II toxin-antitoxin system HipA family toxin [Thalassospira xianhensis]|uniref:type II toxin-antitoxin system HipA family toxin n=1 Tax=Thalassospira xianhensis TaxID=478503 RepID=UPI000DED85A5|nr:type II toxin-antitoxin system HipA family toxin [Thalassospira xianhensis]
MASRRIFMRLGEAGIPVGELIITTDGSRETSVFKYDQAWLEDSRAFALSPGMRLTEAPYYFNSENGSSLPSPVADGTPDSWGRAIIKASLGGRACTDMDFLLESADFLRQGALRYYDSRDVDAPALAQYDRKSNEISIPRLIDLEQFIIEARAFEADPAQYRENRAKMVGGDYLKDAVGTLGGARPKVNALDDDGALWIVKMAKMDDQYSVAHAEVLALTLAREVGILASDAKILPSSQKYPVSIIRRFDRNASGVRLPFISAQTFLDLPGTAAGNYVDIAFQMNEWSADPENEKRELFKRVVFNILIQNTDDHLRNLGFLYGGEGRWLLSPAFDVNPVPERGNTLKTAISDIHGFELDIDSLIDASPLFDVSEEQAVDIIGTMARIIKAQWRNVAGRLGMPSRDIRYIAPAFENEQIESAILLKTKSENV